MSSSAHLPRVKDAQGNCNPVFPHEFIKVNTVFEVIRAAGGYTARTDKHPAYDWVNGPSGAGVVDLFTPEINSPIANGGTFNGVDLTASLSLCDGTTNSLPLPKLSDYTTCEPAVMAYDDVMVQSIINEIDGKSSDGMKRAPVPTILGMNFQQVSVMPSRPLEPKAAHKERPGSCRRAAAQGRRRLARVRGGISRIRGHLHTARAP